MVKTKCPVRAALPLTLCFISSVFCAPRGEEDYHVQHNDGSYEFGYDNDNNFHHAKASDRNIVRGEFGGRNPKTGGIDVVQYTAGPRGFRPRGSNVVRKYDLSQVPRGPIASHDDPYFDPNEDPSYEFAFKTRTYQKSESANKLGDVQGQYSYLDDVGERHNVEYIAGRHTGFHVKTAYPDSNPRAYGSLFFNGRGRPIPRGRTSIQRGLDGSYRFVATGPDQRRTEQSDAHGNIRGSYTYLDDKGVQHSVHYIAGPQIGYRVLKNVKGPHLPSVFPFSRPDITSDDFYNYLDQQSKQDDFNFGSGTTGDKANQPYGDGDRDEDDGSYGSSSGRPRPSSRPNRPTQKPSGTRPSKPSYDYDFGAYGDFDDGSNIGDDLFGGRGRGSSTERPPGSSRPTSASSTGTSSGSTSTYEDNGNDDDSDLFGRDPSIRPSQRPSTRPFSTTSRPTSLRPSYGDSSEAAGGYSTDGLFGYQGASGTSIGTSGAKNTPELTIGSRRGGPKTLVTNLGDRIFSVPPGVSVHAHVQSIDLYPYESKVPSPADQFRAETSYAPQRLTTRRDINPLNEARIMESSSSTLPPTTGTSTSAIRAELQTDNSKNQQDGDGEQELQDERVLNATTTTRSENKNKLTNTKRKLKE